MPRKELYVKAGKLVIVSLRNRSEKNVGITFDDQLYDPNGFTHPINNVGCSVNRPKIYFAVHDESCVRKESITWEETHTNLF